MSGFGIPVCRECQHYFRSCRAATYRPQICNRPTAIGFELVNGETSVTESRLCSTERARERSLFLRRPLCGPQGRYFEPLEKPSTQPRSAQRGD